MTHESGPIRKLGLSTDDLPNRELRNEEVEWPDSWILIVMNKKGRRFDGVYLSFFVCVHYFKSELKDPS